jgi:transcriptional regulator with XRE-family HTH domain
MAPHRSRSKRSTPAPQALTLAELRRFRGLTQIQLAAAAGMDQSELSKAERRPDHRVSTLRLYVEALGGELEIFARFGSERVRLEGV